MAKRTTAAILRSKSGARDWIRTSTSLRTLRPEHSASTNFATRASFFRTAKVFKKHKCTMLFMKLNPTFFKIHAFINPNGAK